jgi:hypothetical protein
VARTRHQAPRRTLGAAARRADLANPQLVAQVIRRQEGWQEKAWALNASVPEIGQTVRWAGNLMSKLGLYVAWRDPAAPGADPQPVRDAAGVVVEGLDPTLVAQAEAELARLDTGWGGLPQLLRAIATQLDVAGEGYLVGWAERPGPVMMPDGSMVGEAAGPERIEMRSTSEVWRQGDEVSVGDTKATARILNDAAGDFIIRVWCPSPQYAERPDSPMVQLIDDGEVLQILTGQMRAEGLSRRSAGILLMPNEIEPVSYPEDVPGDPETGDDLT